MNSFPYLFLVATFLLLIAAAVRRLRTPALHPERQARTDMAILLGIAFVGQIFLLARSRYVVGTLSFYIWSAALLPIVILTVIYVVKLFRAYRDSQ